MQVAQKLWTAEKGWTDLPSPVLPQAPQLVLMFASREILEEGTRFNEVRVMYPQSKIISCSTAGEILDVRVRDDSVSLSAILFGKTTLEFAESPISESKESYDVGKKLAEELKNKGSLAHVMVFADGQKVNGTTLANGFNETLPTGITVTGGLVGDGAKFKKTLVGLDNSGKEGNVVAVGFYGTALKVGYGSLGGWDPFGLERTVTKSKDNVLFELDGKPALALYKEYLGEQAKGLPGTGLLFPLRLRYKNARGIDVEVARTILGVNEADQSMIFAGDMPEGAQAMLMKANFERLIDGAAGAGSMSVKKIGANSAELAILISCIGRKLILKERVEEEVEAVRAEIGAQSAMTGFYSYGELSPTAATENQCDLHNQTMTITTFREE